MMSKTVLFDMDGVILDSMPFHVKAWQESMKEEGFLVDEELLYLHEGAIEPETAVSIFCSSGHEMTELQFNRVMARQIEIFRSRYFAHVRPYPEILPLLENLRREGWGMAVVTSSHASVMEDVLPKEIRGLMLCIVTGDSVERRKPDPAPYLTAMKQLDVTPSECTVVENAPAGIRAAQAASVRCIAISTTLAPKHLHEADYIAEDHEHLYRIITDEF